MADVSNRTIVSLLAVALVITVVGTTVSVSKLSSLGGSYEVLTGAATGTDTGTGTLTVSSVTEVTFNNATIAFGTGRVNNTFESCTLDSAAANDAACLSFTDVVTGFELENTGNTNVTLNLSSDVAAAYYLGSNDAAASFKWKVAESESNSCGGNIGTIASYTEVTTAHQLACGNFDYVDDSDLLGINIQLEVPSDAGSGAHTATITATATSS